MAEAVIDLPVKQAGPRNIGGLKDVVSSPKFSTGVGLLKYGIRNLQKRRFPIREKNVYDKIRGSMVSWLRDIF